jgi:hypothetical protein
MSLLLGVQVPGAPPLMPGVPVHAAATQWPAVPPLPVVSQMGVATLPLHCESEVHGPHVLGVDAPQMGPAELPVQSVFVQQLPGTHVLLPPTEQQKSAGLPHVVSSVQVVPAVQRPLAPGLLQKSPGP